MGKYAYVKNGELPATAIMTKWKADGLGQASNTGYELREFSGGLTKREHFAGLAMQGLLSSEGGYRVVPNGIASQAVVVADALLKALEDK